MTEDTILIQTNTGSVEGDLAVPVRADGLVIFAHGTGSSRHSKRNRNVAAHLRNAGFATLLMDLLTTQEADEERYTRHHRFDIQLLLDRLVAATDLATSRSDVGGLPVGYFGASTGAAAALAAAARSPDRVRAVVSRGGRPDLAHGMLPVVTAPTLLIVGGADGQVIDLNRQAMARMANAEVRLEIVPNATHLFPEPGALETVSRLAEEWFRTHLDASTSRS